jgi:hypothetical protein
MNMNNTEKIMKLISVYNPEDCGLSCDASDKCLGGWYNAEKKECWNSEVDFEKYRDYFYY